MRSLSRRDSLAHSFLQPRVERRIGETRLELLHVTVFCSSIAELPFSAGTVVVKLGGQRLRKPILLAAIYAGRAVVIAIFLAVPLTPLSVSVFAIAIGLLWMSTVPLTNGTIASIFGVEHLSMLGGVVFLCHQVGAFLGGWLGGVVYDATGRYDAMWTMSIGLMSRRQVFWKRAA